MDYLLPGILILGVLLFVYGWIRVIIGGFYHHPMTGLVAVLPGINLLVLPAVWHRVGKAVIVGFVGILLAAGSWFLGAEPKVNKLAGKFGFTITDKVVEASGAVLGAPAESAAEPQSMTYSFDLPDKAAAPPEAEMHAGDAAANEAAALMDKPAVTEKALPPNALYHIVFEPVALDKLANATGQYAHLTQKDGRKREGKIMAGTAEQIQLQERRGGGEVTSTIRLGDIRDGALMVKRQGEGE